MLSTGWSRFSSTLSPGHATHPLSLFTILQNAAGQAWSRRAAVKTRHYSTTVPHDTPYTCLFGDEKLVGSSTQPSGSTHDDPGYSRTFPRRAQQRRARVVPASCALFSRPRSGVCHLESATDDDVNSIYPGRFIEIPDSSTAGAGLAGTPCIWGDPVLAQPRPPPLRPTIHPLPPATSRAILYQNMLRLSLRFPPITLPQLVDYHDLHPETRSTRSYNLLINMALRTASFGTVQLLLRSMAAEDIKQNAETLALAIRWQIRIGNWDAAWQALNGRGSLPFISDHPSIIGGLDSIRWPDFLWLEFFGTLKRRSLRRKGKILHESGDPFVLYGQRFLRLMDTRPESSLIAAKPRIVHAIVYVQLQLQQQEHALKLAHTYLSNLPLHLSRRRVLHCLDIIHVLIVFGSRKRGIRRFHEHRRILSSLLATHSSLKPTSTTLFLLLGSLRGAMRSGTLASDCLARFKSRWGAAIEDRRVLNRVASLALKQGRLDISSRISRDMRVARERSSSLPRPVIRADPRRFSRRPRYKCVFRGIGKEQAMLVRLGKRTRRVKRRRLLKISN